MKKIFTTAVFLLVAFFTEAQIRYLKGTLQGSQEVPAVVSGGGGIVIVKLNTANKTIEVIGNYSGLTSNINNSHIHAGAPGVAGLVVVPLANTGGTAGTVSGTATVSQGFADSLLAGNTYANVHTTINGGGELRAQLTPTTDGQTDFYTGRIQSAQEVPPNPSLATGNVTALLDKATLQVFLTADFHNIAANASASHIHRGPVGVSGPVIVPLAATADVSGTAWGSATVTSTFADSMIAGNTYFNIHNSVYPAGEVRAQLTKLSQVRFLTAVLQGSQQVPANASVGKGTVIVKYSADTKTLELIGDYQNVSAPITASHIHSPGAPGVNAAVIIPLNNTAGTSGVLSGTATLTSTQESELLNGLMYVNVHNANYPGGEIRGQLTTTTAGQVHYFTNMLSSSQQVPVNASTATGNVNVLLDRSTLQVFVTGNFNNLVAAASAAHLHRGLTGTNGPVIVPLSATADVSGTITGSSVVTSSFADFMILGYTYANIHNSVYPGGEIRAQLGDLILPVRLVYFNGYKDNGKVVLLWQSAQEVNVSHYEVEQQNAETGEWIKKATVAATGGSVITNYRSIDVPMIGKKDYVLYRLKTVDATGGFTYSAIIKINLAQSKATLSIAPNPVVSSSLVLTVTGLVNEQKAEISVIDFSGRTMLKTVASTLSNNMINVSKLSAGMYKLVVKINDEVLQQSFSKQ